MEVLQRNQLNIDLRCNTAYMKFKIKWEDNGFYIKFFNKIDNQTILDANYGIYGKIEFEEARFQLLDFLDITDFVAKPDQAKIIGAMDKSASKWNSSMKVAVVTTNSAVIEFTNHYIESLKNTDWTCEVFDSIESAKHWIHHQIP